MSTWPTFDHSRFTGVAVQPAAGEPIERAARRFLRKLRGCGQDREVRERRSYTKPSEMRRRKRARAAYQREREMS